MLSFDYGDLMRLAKKIPLQDDGLRIALLGDCSTQQIKTLLLAMCHERQLKVQLYEAEYNTQDDEILMPDSKLNQGQWDVILLVNCTQHIRDVSMDQHNHNLAERISQTLVSRWEAIHNKHSKSVIMQTNLVMPYERVYGNQDILEPISLRHQVTRINDALGREAQKRMHVVLCDWNYLAGYWGLKQWFDEKMWSLYKVPCNLEFLPRAIGVLVDALAMKSGQSVKCVVVDLDNTLWGGIVSDDGVEGIRVGDFKDGEAYSSLQRFLYRLKQRGILLAVCSKNDESVARAPFQQHSEMILKESDFVAFVANWENKVDNILSIQQSLNIGLDSMVFLDDDTFERSLVRKHLPEIRVPELPEDASLVVQHLCELNLFESNAATAEDKERTELYQKEQARVSVKKNFDTHEDYLKSLAMSIELLPFEASKMPRISQLIQRSNQFNLTTKRRDEAACNQVMLSPDHMGLTLHLKDSFGEYGLISIIILELEAKVLTLDTWLMSCRVLNRGVEQWAMNCVMQWAVENDIQEVRGLYIPTAKNSMVKDFYSKFGFQASDSTDAEIASWTMMPSDYKCLETHFVLEENQWLKAPC